MKDSLLPKLSKFLFWDCNTDLLDPSVDRNLILERVFSLGTENDEKEIFNYYSKDLIKHSIQDIKYLDKKTLNYLSIVFDVPKEEFKCYKHSLSKNPFGIS